MPPKFLGSSLHLKNLLCFTIDFLMTSFSLQMLNKYLYYADLGDEIVSISADQIDDMIDLTKNHIETI